MWTTNRNGVKDLVTKQQTNDEKEETKNNGERCHVLYNSFRQKNPCCILAFKSQHNKTPHRRQMNSPYLNITAVCTFPSCSARYFFKRKKEPVGDNPVKISVLQRGQTADHENSDQHQTQEKGELQEPYTKELVNSSTLNLKNTSS